MLSETAVQSAIHDDAPPWVRNIGLVAGPLLATAAVVWAHPDLGAGAARASQAWTIGVLTLMAVWWMTTAIDMAMTALLPVLLFPLLGVGTFQESATGYVDNVIFLFAGGAALGLALERTSVSGRFAGALLVMAGSSPGRMVAALFTASALISGWVSNTATAAMMLPVAIATTRWMDRASLPGPARERGLRNFGICCMLAVAYGASVGGVITLIGSPPNLIAAEWLKKQGVEVSFLSWMMFSVPVVAIFGPLLVLTLLLLNPVRGLKLPERDTTPLRLTSGELGLGGWLTMAVFFLTAGAWIVHPLIKEIPKGVVSDGSIAIAAALLLFMLPRTVKPWSPILDGSVLRELPWTVLILFGGGLSLAEAMQRTGVSEMIGQSFGSLQWLPVPVAVGCIVGVLVFASEIASNTALTATAVPIVGALAPSLGVSPEELVIPAALGASYAFMMPVGTPPNAMVYATGRVPLRSMLRTGLALNVIGAIVVTVLAAVLL